uniref:Family with sequence similarity 210 member B n=1 Tax=Pelusios castaneus TaxID=367368 RepID=A0A8C8S984_9SAUR
MRWLLPLGPPGGPRALGCGARAVWGQVGSGCSPPKAAAGAAGGPVQAGPGGGEAPHRRQHGSSLLQGCSWLLLGNRSLQSPLRFLLAADPSRSAAKAAYLTPRTGSGPLPRALEDAELSHLHPPITLQAAASNSPSSGSRKDTNRSPEKEATDPGDEDEKKANKSQQLKKVFKEYGAVGVSFHVGISLISLGVFYLAVSSGMDMTAVLLKLGFNEALVQSKVAAGTSSFVLAYAIHKVFAPLRISITLVSVPFLVRYFRKIGFFKPPASNP